MTMTLIDEGFAARRNDPWTSQQAVEQMNKSQITEKIYNAVLNLLLTQGPQTDEELLHKLELDPEVSPYLTPSGLRTRRKRMQRLNVVFDTGYTRPTLAGKRAILWGLVGIHTTAGE